MIKTIISVVTIYGALSSAASSNRLLLQHPPEFIPIIDTGVPAHIPPGPVDPAPVDPVPPAVPAPAPVDPAPVDPVDPSIPWVAPVLPPASIISTVFECNLPNTARAGCAGRITNLENAAQNFVMKCANIGACAAAQINFVYTNSFVERVEQIVFSEMYAGYGATISIDSTNSLRKQYIDKFECKKYGACMDTNVHLIGGASLNDVNCPMPNYCSNCNIKICEWDTVDPSILLCGTGKPCFNY